MNAIHRQTTWPGFMVAWLVAGLVACSQAPQPAPTTERPQIDFELASTATPAKRIPDEQITVLFSTTWDADDKATREYPANAGRPDLDDIAWLQCVQLQTRVFFKDAGLVWMASGSKQLVPLPWESQAFHEKIRIIDDRHFAYDNGDIWIVFRDIAKDHRQ